MQKLLNLVSLIESIRFDSSKRIPGRVGLYILGGAFRVGWGVCALNSNN
jgi:hypothetical protein